MWLGFSGSGDSRRPWVAHDSTDRSGRCRGHRHMSAGRVGSCHWPLLPVRCTRVSNGGVEDAYEVVFAEIPKLQCGELGAEVSDYTVCDTKPMCDFSHELHHGFG